MEMDQDAIIRYIAETFAAGVEAITGDDGYGEGDTFFFYDLDRDTDPTRRLPFATIVSKDYGEFDNASNLDRPGVFRLNIGVGRNAYIALFGEPPDVAIWGDSEHDFTALDRLLPHPVYASQWWVCVLNPGVETFAQEIQPLLAEAHGLDARRHRSRRP